MSRPTRRPHRDSPVITVELELRVRRVVEADLPALEWYGMFAAHRSIIRETYERQKAGEVDMLIADLRGSPAAQAWIDRTKRAAERVGVLWAVRVFPMLRGLGLGARMVQAAEAELRRRELVAAELGVEKHNRAARRFYHRLGYVEIGEVRERYAYRLPDGRRVEATADQWLLRKRF